MTTMITAAPLAQHIREATLASHRTLNHHPLLAPLTRSPLDQSAYCHSLAALHGPQCALEGLLSGFAPAQDFPPRSPDLERDLQALGIDPQPLRITLPELRSNSQLLGAMYVIEGSNLGGALIARLIESSLPPETPRHFFTNAGTQSRWGKFWSWVEQHRAMIDSEVMAAAACQTFDLYKAHLDACLHHIEHNQDCQASA